MSNGGEPGLGLITPVSVVQAMECKFVILGLQKNNYLLSWYKSTNTDAEGAARRTE